jgi:predicted secreted protein
MKAYSENTDPSKLADQINQTMRWGLETAKKTAAIKVRTGAYQTYPVYSEKNKVQRWRGQQELFLEGREVDKLSELVGTLQSRLQMQSMQFSVSPDARRKVQDVLIEEVLQAYKKRAELVSKSLGAAGYDIMNISIQTSGHIYPPPVRMESMRAVSKASVESPAMEAGTSRVSVQANGSIHLQR